jgi:16S rRNA (uracil1498-N3)-methyltransferase
VAPTPGEPANPGEPAGAGASGWVVQARRAAAHVFVDDLARPRLGPDDRHHLERVLRLRAGEVVSTVDGRGGWRPCRLGPGGELQPTGESVTPPRPLPDLTVGFAVTKADRPEWAVQKLTEVGVDRILPLRSGRSVVRWEGDRAERHLDRLREVARQAAMQSRRLRVPVIEAVVPVDALLAPDAPWSASLALAAPGGRPPSLSRPMILIGPEGGWTPEEETAAPATVDLGPLVLRTETAALVAGALLAALRHSLLSESHVLR